MDNRAQSAQAATTLLVDDVSVALVRRAVRQMRISLHPPVGAVRVVAPQRLGEDVIAAFIRSKMAWITKHRQRFAECYAKREAARTASDPQQMMLWGRAVRREILAVDQDCGCALNGDALVVRVRRNASPAQIEAQIDAWLGRSLSERAAVLVAHWSAVMRVQAARVSIRRMRSRWGSCTPSTRSIRLNLALAAYAPSCLEYVVVHELAHLLVAGHGPRFHAVLDRTLPDWRERRAGLRDASRNGGW